MNKHLEVIFDNGSIKLKPGDMIDMPGIGLLYFFDEPFAEAVRIFIKQSQHNVTSAIEFTKEKYGIKS